MQVQNLINAWNAYATAKTAAELGENGEIDIYKLGSYRAPTAQEYAGYIIDREGGAEAGLLAMQAKGQRVGSDMESISRQTAAIIAAAIIADKG
jgi:hypothetical protein